jgi:hypothetical protein
MYNKKTTSYSMYRPAKWHGRGKEEWYRRTCEKAGTPTVKRKRVRCLTTGKEWDNITEAAAERGVTEGGIVMGMRKDRPVKGYLYQYIDESAKS